MIRYQRENREHVQEIFEKKTGVSLPGRRGVCRPLRVAALVAAAVALCVTSAFAFGLFSSLDGDELQLTAEYQGEGVVAVLVENQSDKPLRFQEQLKLMRWSTGQEVEPSGGAVTFSGTEIAAQASGTMTIDLSAAYDVALLEEPLPSGDWYYLVLTNNGFAFGQDWMCTVTFADAQPDEQEQEEAKLPETEEAVLQGVHEKLRPYFETVTLDVDQRRAMNAAYMEEVKALIAQSGKDVVPSADVMFVLDDPAEGVVLDETVPAEEQYLLMGQHSLSSDWNFKLLATDTERALVLSAELPLEGAPGSTRSMPLFYLLAYEKAEIREDACAFVYGRLLSFEKMEDLKVYEDETYVCYEISPLVYTDLEAHTRSFLDANPDVADSEAVWTRAENIWQYYRKNMGELIRFR